jgi:hypothetical protein
MSELDRAKESNARFHPQKIDDGDETRNGEASRDDDRTSIRSHASSTTTLVAESSNHILSTRAHRSLVARCPPTSWIKVKRRHLEDESYIKERQRALPPVDWRKPGDFNTDIFNIRIDKIPAAAFRPRIESKIESNTMIYWIVNSWKILNSSDSCLDPFSCYIELYRPWTGPTLGEAVFNDKITLSLVEGWESNHI